MINKKDSGMLPKPVAIAMLSCLGVGVVILAAFITPQVCRMLKEKYRNNTVSLQVNAVTEPTDTLPSSSASSSDDRQTNPTGSSNPDNGNEDNYNEHGNNQQTEPGQVTEPTETNPTSTITDGQTVINASDIPGSPYAGVANVVYDVDKGHYFYIIQKGDTLSEISGKVHVPIDVLVELNSIPNKNLIYRNASLVLP